MIFEASNGVEEEDQAEQANIQIIFILLSVSVSETFMYVTSKFK